MNKNDARALFELKRKSPVVAGFFSFLFVGAGQLYNGDYFKGFFLFFSCLVMWIVWLGWIVWVVSVFEAYATAKRNNKILGFELGVKED